MFYLDIYIFYTLFEVARNVVELHYRLLLVQHIMGDYALMLPGGGKYIYIYIYYFEFTDVNILS